MTAPPRVRANHEGRPRDQAEADRDPDADQQAPAPAIPGPEPGPGGAAAWGSPAITQWVPIELNWISRP
jgi:hypothetical protein